MQMLRRIALMTATIMLLVGGLVNEISAQIIITEILQNPAAVADSDGEWFEVHNPTATAVDIDGWTIQDNDFDSHVISNGGPLNVPPGGFIVLGRNQDFATNGGVTVNYQYSGISLANGDDELVLLDGSLVEIDRVEWDGGVNFPDPNGASMSLTAPNLDNSNGANWCVASTPFGDGDLGTPGAENDCPIIIPQVIITEIMQNPAAVSDGSGEWFEVHNPTSSAIDMNGWTIKDNDFDSHVISNGGPLNIPAGGFLVLGNNADTGTNGGVSVDYQYSGIFLGNSADELVLVDTGLNEIDRVEWDNGATFPDPNGASMALIDPNLDNADGSNWCTASTPFGAGDLGTPGALNDCVTGLPDIVINEVDADQSGTDSAEFIELYDGGVGNTDLTGLVLVLFNGNGDVSYNAFDLDGQSTDGAGFFVVCGDAANVPNCGFDVSPNTNLIQNGADAVALYVGDASDFPGGTPVTTANLVDALVYDTDDADDAGLLVLLNPGQPQVNERGGGNGTGHSNSRVPDGGIPRNTDTYTQQAPTPGITNIIPVPVVEIFEIQGSGAASPFAGQLVETLDNIVTGVAGNGFFMQTPDARTDGDVTTSDGIFVFTGSTPSVAVGDQVDVTGQVAEFFELTEISGSPTVSIDGSGNPLPAIVTLDQNMPSGVGQTVPELERYEGMRVSFSGIASGPTDRFGDAAVVARTQRSFREPGIEFPGMPGLPVWDGNPEVFEINPDGLGLSGADIFATQTVSASGPLTFAFGDYQVLPEVPATLGPTPTLPRSVRARGFAEFTIATQNMFRLFDDEDDPNIDDPVIDPVEYAARLNKFSLHIREILGAPDILAVQEVENLTVLQDLAAKIQSDDPALLYTPFLQEGNDIGGIDVGFLVRNTVQVNTVAQLGASETFLNPLTGQQDILHDRPPLLLEGVLTGNGFEMPVTVLGVHLRSLSGIDNATQGQRVRAKRNAQATSVSLMVDSLQTADPNINLVVTGDFNAFQFTDGYVDVLGQIQGTPADASQALIPGTDQVDPDLTNQILSLQPEEQYSFVFGGSAQSLDHMLTSQALNPFVSDVAYVRGNADAPDSFGDDGATPLRASDHDGLVLNISYHNLVLLADKQITVHGQATSEGDVHSNDRIDFEKGNPSTHHGNLTAVGDITIAKDNTIAGDVTTGTVLKLDDDASVTGTVSENANVAAIPLPTLSFSSGGNDVKVKKGESLNLTPGSYGDIMVEANGILLLSHDGTSGDYFFRKLQVKKEAKVSVDVTNGAVTTNVVKEIKFDKDTEVEIAPQDNNSTRLLTFNCLKKVTFDKGAVIRGTVIAPDDVVELKKDVWFQGSICASKIVVDKDGTFLRHGSTTILPKALRVVAGNQDAQTTHDVIPTEFRLEQNYPNPFNPETRIQFQLPEASRVVIRIFNALGQEIVKLADHEYEPGFHSLVWNARDRNGNPVASGLYLYSLKAGNFSQVRKMTLLR